MSNPEGDPTIRQIESEFSIFGGEEVNHMFGDEVSSIDRPAGEPTTKLVAHFGEKGVTVSFENIEPESEK